MISFYVLFAALFAFVNAKSSTGDSVLVLLDSGLDKEGFSVFFGGLEERGYDLTFRDPKQHEPVVRKFDEPNFDHVIVFAPETKTFADDITPQSLVSLVNSGTNLLLALPSKQNFLNSLASEFSLILPPPGTPLVSHFPERDDPATVIPIPVSSNPITTPGLAPVWFSGIPHALNNNPLLVPILNAPAESFAADSSSDSGAEAVVDASEKGGEGLWAGSSLSVVTGFQTRDSGRVTWVGGVDMFSDAFATKEVAPGKASGNRQFSREVAGWTFQENHVLRIDRVSHHKLNHPETPQTYTINDQIVYTAHVSKYNAASSEWEPYSGINDMQLEFTMLDPHIRTAVLPVAGSPGEYSVTFRAPDRHGVFKFVIDYKRKGWTQLQSSTTVPVVPPRHDGYPRFLSAAWPYYAGAISTSIGFVVFSALWLAGDDKVKKSKTE